MAWPAIGETWSSSEHVRHYILSLPQDGAQTIGCSFIRTKEAEISGLSQDVAQEFTQLDRRSAETWPGPARQGHSRQHSETPGPSESAAINVRVRTHSAVSRGASASSSKRAPSRSNSSSGL
jgi:hypothetical protein